MLKQMKDTVRIRGKGTTKELAIANAFGEIQKIVIQKYGKIIVQIKPVEASVLSANAMIYTEKFLFFFFSRKRTTYVITFDVAIEVSYMEQEKIEFKAVTKTSSLRGSMLDSSGVNARGKQMSLKER